ncbi:MAG: hypothetical protein OXU54_04895 [Gammaproteobacteria bacterium]|nr:hypothetical protein [Gammaproteobacteria bacterium]
MENTTTMTETAVFDTLAVARDLEQAGFDRRQAEALARALAAVQGSLATKEGLAQLELRLESKIEALRTIMLVVFLPFQLTILALVLPPYFGG